MTTSRILPPTYLAVSIIAIAVLHFVIPLGRLVQPPWSHLGVILLAGGVALNISADRAFKHHKTTVKPFEEPAALVTGGVFRLTRNPMYLGFVLMLGGIALLLGSVSPWVVVAAFAVAIDRVFIRAEERALEGRFAADWLAYRSRVRRWI